MIAALPVAVALTASVPLQANETGGATQEIVERALQPIAEGDVLARGDTVSADLRRLDRFVAPLPQIVRIESWLEVREAGVVELLADLDAMASAGISTRRLADQRLPWEELDRELSSRRLTVQTRYSALQKQRERLREEREVWELTAQRALESDLAPEVRRRIEAILVRIHDVEARLRTRRNEVGAIHDRLTNTAEEVASAREQLDAATASLRRDALERDTGPLWRDFGTGGPDTWPAAVASASDYWWNAFRRWVRLERAALFGMVALFLGAYVVASRLGRTVDDPGAGRALPDRTRILAERPLFFALLASIVVAPLATPMATTAADPIFVLICIVLLGLRSLALAPPLQSAVPGLCVLTVAVRISSMAPEDSSLERLLLTATSGSAFAMFAAWVHRHRSALRELAGIEWLLALLSPLAVISTGVAFVAVVLGWVDLARLLCPGSILSPTVGVFWAIAVNAAAAVTETAIGGRLGEALPSLRRERTAVMHAASTVFTLVGLLSWSRYTLLRYQVLDFVTETWAGLAGANVGIGGLELSVGGLVSAAVVVLITYLVSRLVRFVLLQEIAPRVAVDVGVTESVVTVSSYAVYGIGIALAASAAGLSGTQLTVVIGALSVGIGFGLQNIVGNFVSGLILIFERPIRVGDIVETPDQWGHITRIGIRASTIRSFDGAELIVPNADLIAKQVINWTRSDRLRRVVVPIGVAYGSDPKEVLEILIRVASDHPFALDDPAPDAQMLGYGDSSLNFRVRVWTQMDHWIPFASDLNVAIGTALAEAGITIPFPQRDLHLKTVGSDVMRLAASAPAETPDSGAPADEETDRT